VEGTLFGRYRLIELLGRGGMGEVWRAQDTAANDRTVAIKMLAPHLAKDDMFVARFRREADAAAQLSNPHIIPIHNYGEIDGRLYVDMRLIEGRDLQQVLAAGPMEPSRAVRVIEQVAKALHAAHKVGLVHRDVKPSNVLLDEDDFAYLIDFGIARATEDTRLTRTGSMIGTLHYLAPERFGDAEVDARSDIYALACVFYECLTGSTPYPGDSFEQQIAAHLMQPPPRPSSTDPNIPLQVDEVIATGMAKDPNHRYATTVELARAAADAITMPIRRPARETPAPTRGETPAPAPFVVNPAPHPPAALNYAAPPPRPSAPPPPIPPPPQQDQRPGLPRNAVLIAAAAVIAVSAVIVVGFLLQPRSPASQASAARTAPPTEQAPPPAGQTAQPAPPPTQASAPAPSFAAVEQTACAQLGPARDSDGHRCAIATMRVSATAPEWVFVQGLGYYNGTAEPPSFSDLAGQAENMILNVSTQLTVGPTDTGWCPPETGDSPIRGYTSVPPAVLAEFGLSPCVP
jgi:serine/threonine-protein kinase